MVSQIHDNLILLFYDYITEKPFLSFIGENEVSKTAKLLLDYSRQKYREDCLLLIPECVAQRLSPDFTVTLDADSHDYILSVEYLSSLKFIAGASNPAAYSCKKFLNLYPHCQVKKCTSFEIVKEDYIALFKQWAKSKNLEHWELNEYSAFEKFLQNRECNNYIVSIYDDNKMIGFSTFELLLNDYAICHFAKADSTYKGVYDWLFYVLGTVLAEHGVRYWNFEQDLGIANLRQSKRKYKPAFYLKKYIVS